MKIERIDSLPLLYHWLDQMKVAVIIDQIWSRPSKWQGLSFGQLAVLFLMYVISTRNHRLSGMEDWVEQHRNTIEQITSWQIGSKDATDDRLGYLLEQLGKDEEKSQQYHHQAGQHLIQAYELPTEVARFDTTSFNVHHDENDATKEILTFGYSKDKRPDLLQFKQGLGTLDPAGVPIFSQTLAGNQADDPLYTVAWQEMCKTIGHTNFLFVGDCKGASLETRSTISQQGGYYLFPLPMTGNTPDQLKQLVLFSAIEPTAIELANQKGEVVQVGIGFETRNPENNSENWLVTQSKAFAESQQKSLLSRLDKAEQAVNKLKPRLGEKAVEFEQRALRIIQQHKVTGLLTVTVTETSCLSKTYIGRGKPGPDRAYRFICKQSLELRVTREQTAIDTELKLCGWRIYATNCCQLTPTSATKYYKGQWTNERGYHRFKRGAIPALPLYLRIPQRIKGLMFLLMIALQLLTLMEFVVQKELNGTELSGLVPGNPKIKTARPSAERILSQFENIHLLINSKFQKRIEVLTDLQCHLLALMNVPEDIYDF